MVANLSRIPAILAPLCTGTFFGAALYITLVEHPARVEAGIDVALREFPPSYRRAARLQGGLALTGSLLAVSAWALGGGVIWIYSAALLFAVVPLTLLIIYPTNARLHDAALSPDSPAAPFLLRRWGILHAMRTVLGFLAFALQIAARPS